MECAEERRQRELEIITRNLDIIPEEVRKYFDGNGRNAKVDPEFYEAYAPNDATRKELGDAGYEYAAFRRFNRLIGLA